jgi:hypothetical protein
MTAVWRKLSGGGLPACLGGHADRERVWGWKPRRQAGSLPHYHRVRGESGHAFINSRCSSFGVSDRQESPETHPRRQVQSPFPPRGSASPNEGVASLDFFLSPRGTSGERTEEGCPKNKPPLPSHASIRWRREFPGLCARLAPRNRSAPVPGRSQLGRSKGFGNKRAPETSDVSAPEDGRTPFGYWAGLRICTALNQRYASAWVAAARALMGAKSGAF